MHTIFLLGIILIFLLVSAGGVWLIVNYLKAECIITITKKCRVLGVFCAILPLFLCCLLLKYNTVTVFVAAVHLFVISFLTKAIIFLFGKLFHFSLRNDVTLGIGLILTVCVLLYGFVNMHTIKKTAYSLTTDKQVPENGFRIAMISDVHLSTCINGSDFEKLIGTISENKPDVLLICGDFVDESSQTDDFVQACAALRQIDVPNGVCFVFGNHDSGIYGKRDISKNLLKSSLEKAGVHILEDSFIDLGEITLIGRSDASDRNRKSAMELIESTDPDTFTVIMDHQPTDYGNESAAMADLVLSGHTHGGQMFPAGQLGMLLKANDLLYGSEIRNKTTFIVSSGASGWSIPFKTGTVSEFVLIDILPE